MRLKQCCCGCSLRTGTLTFLWLDLIYQVWTFISLAVAACYSVNTYSFFQLARLAWASFMIGVVIYGMIGIEKHRPSYLLLYISVNILIFVSLLFVTIFCVQSEAVHENIYAFLGALSHSPSQIHQRYNDVMSSVISMLIFCMVLFFYFIVVIYSYYRQMQKEDQSICNPPSGTGYVTYAAPAMRARGNVCPSTYDQQPTVTAYPQQSAASPFLTKNIG